MVGVAALSPVLHCLYLVEGHLLLLLLLLLLLHLLLVLFQQNLEVHFFFVGRRILQKLFESGPLATEVQI